MAKITFKKSGWLTYAIFITLMVSVVYYTQHFRYGNNSDSFKPAIILWPVATILAIVYYLNHYIRRNRFLDYSAILSIVFLFSTLMTFTGNLVSLSANMINNIIWWSLMLVFYRYADQCGIEKKYIVTAMVTIPILGVVFMQLVNSNIIENSVIRTLNPIYYALYLVPFALMNKKKIFQYVGLGIVFIAILVSNKRTALIAFVIVLVFYTIRNHRESSRSISSMVRNLILLMVLLVGLYFLSNMVLSSYSMIDWRERLLALGDTAGGGRMGRWELFFEDIGASTFWELLFGHGFVYPYYHNDLFQVYYNSGIPGLVVYVGMCILLIQEYSKMAKKKYEYATAYGASLIIFFFNSMVGEVIIVHTWMLEMGVFWGLVLGDFRRFQRQESERAMLEND